MFSFMANTLGHFYKNFQGFTYCSVFKVLCCCRLIDSSFTITQLHSLVNNFFQLFSKFFNFVSVERRRRDLNPRAATNDLLPFQGSPFNHLGTSASGWITFLSESIFNSVPGTHHLSSALQLTERVGFEPTRPFGQTVFKTASLWPLRYLSKRSLKRTSAFYSTFPLLSSVFFKVFSFFATFLKIPDLIQSLICGFSLYLLGFLRFFIIRKEPFFHALSR